VAEPDARTVAESHASTVAEPDARTVAEPDAQTVAESHASTVAESHASTVAEPDARTVAEPDASTVAEPHASTVAEPDASTVAEPHASTVAEPDASTVAEPDARTVAEPDARTVAEPVWLIVSHTPRGELIVMMSTCSASAACSSACVVTVRVLMWDNPFRCREAGSLVARWPGFAFSVGVSRPAGGCRPGEGGPGRATPAGREGYGVVMVTGAPQTVPVHRGHKSDSSRVSGCSSVMVRAASAGTRA
jgi:hypothetical protein